MSLPRLNLPNVINVVGVVVIMYLVVMLAQTVKKNYTLNQQAKQLQAKTQLLQDQKAELMYQIHYYQTDSFREREARAKLGLQMPGETQVVLPPDPTDTSPTLPADDDATKPKSNFRQRLDFLGGKS